MTQDELNLSKRAFSDTDMKEYLFAGILDHFKVSPSELYAMTDRQIATQFLRARKKDGSIVPPGPANTPDRFKPRPFRCMTEHIRVVLFQLEATAKEFGFRGERDTMERVANLVRIFGMAEEHARKLAAYLPSASMRTDATVFGAVLGWDEERIAQEVDALGS